MVNPIAGVTIAVFAFAATTAVVNHHRKGKRILSTTLEAAVATLSGPPGNLGYDDLCNLHGCRFFVRRLAAFRGAFRAASPGSCGGEGRAK